MSNHNRRKITKSLQPPKPKPKQNFSHIYVSLDTIDALIDIDNRAKSLNRTDFRSFVLCLIASYCKAHGFSALGMIDEMRSILSDN